METVSKMFELNPERKKKFRWKCALRKEIKFYKIIFLDYSILSETSLAALCYVNFIQLNESTQSKSDGSPFKPEQDLIYDFRMSVNQ